MCAHKIEYGMYISSNVFYVGKYCKEGPCTVSSSINFQTKNKII